MDKPWENEPNEKHFEYKGLQCEIHRHHTTGHLCGYVNIPILKQAKGRMAQFQSFFVEYDVDNTDGSDIYDTFDNIFNISVHGGITFSRIVEKEEGKVFCIGFDCGHSGDILPAMESILRRPYSSLPVFDDPIFGRDVYRDINYVEAECKSMVDQLLEEE